MSRIQNPAPDATRRRASTNRKMETIMRLARRLPLTRQVLADQLETATPSQMEFMDQWMNAEIESRERSKRSRLLKQAGFPAVKTLDGYDWENIRFPVDWGRRSLESLEFASRPEDVVMFGPPGTGKTHLAMALGRKACLEGMTVRFFTAAGLVMRLLHASTEGKLDREIASIGKARLLIIDELGYVPIDEEGSRFCSRSSPTRTRCNPSFTPRTSSSAGGAGCSGIRTWPRRSSTGPCITAGCSGSRASPIAGLMLLCNETIKHEQ